ncbi:ASCH domain-containing protein [Cupriavidus plantarum]|uniref:hypothetical protein n=1 Tax=Cupriavidus plantarum TaxID=942865 RepID=UPI00339D43C1
MTKERPILFSGAMVRAILDGRKTQTRRVAKPVKHPDLGNISTPGALVLEHEPHHVIERACPYGRPGDRLWVRETWQGPMWDGELEDRPADAHSPQYCQYAADGGSTPEFMDADDNLRQGWRPSIHMPRWACRLQLEVTGVRVERLTDCSEADALAEGVTATPDGAFHIEQDMYRAPDPVECYARLWAAINGAESWAANPWVWVVEFRRIEA